LAPLAEALEVEISCFDVGEVAWTASADVPWLTATTRRGRLSGNFYEPDELILDADMSALDPADTPFRGTVTLSAPTLGAVATVDIALEIPDLTARWVKPPPPSLRAGEEFTVSLEIAGNMAAVDGQLDSCASGYLPNKLCLARTRFAITDDGAFAGPPGTFTLSGHRIGTIIDWSPENFFFAKFFATNRAGARTGPFYAPLICVAIPDPERSSLGLQPSRLELFGFAGQNPLVGEFGSTHRAYTRPTGPPSRTRRGCPSRARGEAGASLRCAWASRPPRQSSSLVCGFYVGTPAGTGSTAAKNSHIRRRWFLHVSAVFGCCRGPWLRSQSRGRGFNSPRLHS
jgi:hypothetical protein